MSKEQHDRDSAELRKLCAERDALKAQLADLQSAPAASTPQDELIQNIMHEVFDYAAIADGIGGATGTQREKQRVSMFAQDRKIRAMLQAALSHPAQRDSVDAARYRWLADRVLACDYGDNDAPGEQIGWRIRHDLLPKNGGRQPAFMYGKSVNEAIDAAMQSSNPANKG